MFKIAALGLSSAALIATSGAALAQRPFEQPADARYGYAQISANKLSAAETQLDARRAAEPREPSVLLNLAFVYAKTTRTAEASALYRDVLALPNVQMELGNGKPAWSHDLAKAGLGRSALMASR
ncbi:tetratricopeptide repeat protein [Sphingobium boeckii]|uniref:Flp pilus assembly protein TadD n=1 Tax=Sphingobium boeckii TaxID=1082345 RepID=A0A7W9AG94_9SPHN|nr:tetratricopeptide repeat protein [Sphingobium boeckii]MBB5685079.1 Flp pilus assembly protein TadD [Sphingobium boeckii]